MSIVKYWVIPCLKGMSVYNYRKSGLKQWDILWVCKKFVVYPPLAYAPGNKKIEMHWLYCKDKIKL